MIIKQFRSSHPSGCNLQEDSEVLYFVKETVQSPACHLLTRSGLEERPPSQPSDIAIWEEFFGLLKSFRKKSSAFSFSWSFSDCKASRSFLKRSIFSLALRSSISISFNFSLRSSISSKRDCFFFVFSRFSCFSASESGIRFLKSFFRSGSTLRRSSNFVFFHLFLRANLFDFLLLRWS